MGARIGTGFAPRVVFMLLVALGTSAGVRGGPNDRSCKDLSLPADPDDRALEEHFLAVMRGLSQDPDFARRCPDWGNELLENLEASNRMGSWSRSRAICEVLRTRGLSGMAPEPLLACLDPLLASGELQEVSALMDRALERMQTDREASLRLLRAFVALLENRLRPALAARYLARMQDLVPGDEDLAFRRMQALLEAGDARGAEEQWEVLAERFNGRLPLMRRAVLLALSMDARGLARRVAEVLADSPGLGAEDLDVLIATGVRLRDPSFLRRVCQRWIRQGRGVGERFHRTLEASELLERQGQAPMAADLLAQGIALWGTRNPTLLRRLGRIRGAAGDRNGARDAFQAAVDLSGRDPVVVAEVARAALTVGDGDWARGLMERDREAQASRPTEWWMTLARVRAVGGDRQGATEAWEQAARQSTDPAGTWLAIGKDLLGDRERVELAERAFFRALQEADIGERAGEALLGLVESLVVQGRDCSMHLGALREAIRKGRLAPEALAKVEALAARAPESSPLGVLGLEAGVRREPDRPDRWLRLAWGLLNNGDWERAREAFSEAIRRSPERREALSQAVSALVGAGRVGEAIRLAESFGSTPAPGVSRTLAFACLSLRDSLCLSRFTEVFLRGPVFLDVDYLQFAERLGEMGLRALAMKALEIALRTLPRERAWEALRQGALMAAAWRWDVQYEQWARRLRQTEERPLDAPIRMARGLIEAGRFGLATPWALLSLESPDAAIRSEGLLLLLEIAGAIGDRSLAERAVQESIRTSSDLRPEILRRAHKVLRQYGLHALATMLRSPAGGAWAGEEGDMDLPPILEVRRSWAEDACRRPGPAGDRDCLRAGVLLDRVAPFSEALDLWSRRCRTGLAGEDLRVELAMRLLRQARWNEAVAMVGEWMESGAIQGSLAIERIGQGMREAGLGRSWLELLAPRVQGAIEGDGGGGVLWEWVRTALSLGEVTLVAPLLLRLEQTGGQSEVVWTAWREGACAGRAAEVFGRTALHEGGRWTEKGFRKGLEDLLGFGGDALVEGWKEELSREEGARKDGAFLVRLGKALLSLGDVDGGLFLLSRVAPGMLDDEARLLWIRALWSSGRRTEARRMLTAWWGTGRNGGESPDKTPDTSAGVVAVLGFLLSEKALDDALALVQSWKGPGLPPGLGDPRRARTRMLWAMGRASWEDFLREIAPDEDGLEEGILWVQQAARNGTLDDAVAALGHARGMVAWELHLLARSLQGESDAVLNETVTRTVRDVGDEGPLQEAAARAFFLAGRWELAFRWAERGIRNRGRPDHAGVALLLAAAGMSGRAVEREVLTLLDERVENLAERYALRALVRRWAGDERGEALELAARSRRMSGDWGALREALEAALRAGDDRLAQEMEEEWLQASEDPIGARLELVKIYKNYWKGNAIVRVLGPVVTTWPGEAEWHLERLRGLLMEGRGGEAMEAAEQWVQRAVEPTWAARRVVLLAAEMLELGLLDRWLSFAMQGDSGIAGSRAVLEASAAFARAGGVDRARQALQAWERRVPDQRDWRRRVAERLLGDPTIPLEVVPWTAEGEEGGELLPQERLLRCEAEERTTDLSRCVTEAGLFGRNERVLVSMFLRALAGGKWRAAREWMVLADRRAGGAWPLRLQMARHLTEFLGEPEEADPEVRKEMGRLALDWMSSPGIVYGQGNAAEVSLRAQLQQMASGNLEAALREYRDALRADPSSALLRNALAVLASRSREHLDEAIRQAQIASRLSPSGMAWYLETEAWSRTLRGDLQGGLRLQRRAQRRWTQTDPDGTARGLWNLGRMLEMAGRRQEAMEAWKRAAITAPGTSWSGIRSLRRWREGR